MRLRTAVAPSSLTVIPPTSGHPRGYALPLRLLWGTRREAEASELLPEAGHRAPDLGSEPFRDVIEASEAGSRDRSPHGPSGSTRCSRETSSLPNGLAHCGYPP